MSDSNAGAQALRRIPFFTGLSPEDADGVLQVGKRVSFQPADTIVERGEMGDAMYLMLAGTAEVDVGGRFHTLKQGDFFGEMALIAAKKRMATVKAVEPVEALRIPAEDFQAFLLSHPTVAVAMLKALVERLREVEERVEAWMGSG
jgi:CRP/FNR family transcriptional regulator, cyclic AMP receptor protein